MLASWLMGARARPVSKLTAITWPMVMAFCAISMAPSPTTAMPTPASTAALA